MRPRKHTRVTTALIALGTALAMMLAMMLTVLATASSGSATALSGSSISASLSTTSVRLDGAATLRGQVSGPAGRRVELLRKAGTHWLVVRTKSSDSRGDFSFAVPTDFLAGHRLRAYAPASGHHAQAMTTVKSLTVRPGWDPLGSATDYEQWSPRMYLDPCRVVTYRVNLDRAPRGALADVKAAFARVHDATGIRFAYLGGTGVVPDTASESRWPADTHTIIAWATRAMVGDRLGTGVMASGGPGDGVQVSDDWGHTVWKTTRGSVLFNTEYNSWLKAGFVRNGRGDPTRGAVAMHEIGHIVGLLHGGTDPRQVMRVASLAYKPVNWGAGDLTGLRLQGLQHGCLS